ncbi:aldehyde-activating protein [Streptomyces sp. NPDC048604]|uniref:aldehyde-activating protein n=1 Tax=Streptomyces sp. NPDC048604 TaxID=3365578 RepID=UPI00371F5951
MATSAEPSRSTPPSSAPTKRGFCGTCGGRPAAIDASEPNIGINVTALDEITSKDLVPVAQRFRHDTVSWLPAVSDTRHTPGG